MEVKDRVESCSYFNFNSFPNEIIVHVFNQLNHRERKKCRIVCQRWKNILDNYWKYFAFRSKLDNRTQKQFLNSIQFMQSATMKNYTNPTPKNASFPKIRDVIIGWRNEQQNIITFLKSSVENCKLITIKKFSLGEIMNLELFSKALGKINWKTLSEITINVVLTKYKFERAVRHLEAVSIFLKLAKIPNLETFHFEFSHQYERHRSKELRALRFQNLCLDFYEFVAGNAKTIRSIYCSIVTTRRPSRWFKIPEIPDKFKEIYLTDLKLTYCSLQLWGVSQIESIVTPEFFGTKLRLFHISLTCSQEAYSDGLKGTDANRMIFDLNIRRILANNGKSLLSVQLLNFEYVIPSWFENCCNLFSVFIGLISQQMNGAELLPSWNSNLCLPSSESLLILELNANVELDFSSLCRYKKLCKLKLNVQDGIGRSLQDQHNDASNSTVVNSLAELEIYVDNGSDECAGEIQQLINRHSKTLEIMSIITRLPLFDTVLLDLSECTALNHLEIWNSPAGYMVDTNFTNLTSFRGCFYEYYSNATNDLIEWIAETMPNVVEIGYICYFDPNVTSIVQKLLQMPKVEKVFWLIKGQDGNAPHSIVKFCEQNPGVEMKTGEEYYRVVSVGWISVDRSVYNQNVNSNS